jgi:mannose-6-phosphate isomerase-like protein (cupin superfamily)
MIYHKRIPGSPTPATTKHQEGLSSMIIKDIHQGHYFIAGDQTLLSELLHPARCDATIDVPYSLAHASLRPGEESLRHRLKTSSEVYYILSGTGRMKINEEEEEIRAGQAIYVSPSHWQSLKNIGATDLCFLCIVHPQWRESDEEVGA